MSDCGLEFRKAYQTWRQDEAAPDLQIPGAIRYLSDDGIVLEVSSLKYDNMTGSLLSFLCSCRSAPAMKRQSRRSKSACRPACGSRQEQLPMPTLEWADEFARLARALAHPARVRIVSLLVNRNSCVCGEIVEHLPLAQSTVSQHLKVLRKAGIIDGETDGPRICYWINHAVLGRLRDLLMKLGSCS
jgi:ArsR family transcriptional regulator